jgi:EmrB/QacA subfamily drug resistance transporter
MKNQSQPHARPHAALAVLSAANFVAALDLFIVNVAFNAIGHDYHSASQSDLSWVLNGYAIVFGALLIPAGRLADRYGRRAAFLLGIGVFTAGSAGCAVAPSLWTLVGFRLLQAAGAAILTPSSLGLVLAAFPGKEGPRAVRIWAASGAIAAAAGPVVGGALVQANWRLVFLVNVPIGVVALILGVRLLQESRDPAATRLPDLPGALLLATAIGALSLGLVKGPDWGWGAASTLTAYLIAIVGVAAVAYRSSRHAAPVIEPALLRVRTFAWSNFAAIAFSASFAANMLLLVLWLQRVWGWSAIDTGLGVAPGPMMVPAFAVVAHRLQRRIGSGGVTALGCLMFAASVVLMLTSLGTSSSYSSEILPGLILGGSGIGLALPEIMSASTSTLPADRSSTGSAIINMSRQVGSVLGISVMIAVLGTPHTASQALDQFRTTFWVIAAAGLVGAVLALGMTPRTPVPLIAVDAASETP